MVRGLSLPDSASTTSYPFHACPCYLQRANMLLRRPGVSAILGLVTMSTSLLAADGLVIEKPFQETFEHVPAAFGPDVLRMDPPIESRLLVEAQPRQACVPLTNTMKDGAIALVQRGACNFTQKVLHAQVAGAAAVVVTDTRATEKWLMVMYGSPENTQGIEIPSVLVSHATGERLWRKHAWLPGAKMQASVNATSHMLLQPQTVGILEMLGIYLLFSVLLLAFSGICGLLFALVFTWYQRGQRAHSLDRLKSFKFSRRKAPTADTAKPAAESSAGLRASGVGRGCGGGEVDNGMRLDDDMCAICLDPYEAGENLIGLPCKHSFHDHCIRPWLSVKSGLCPMCKSEAFPRSRWMPPALVSRIEAAFAELAAMCTDNMVVLGLFFLVSVACGVIAAQLSLRR